MTIAREGVSRCDLASDKREREKIAGAGQSLQRDTRFLSIYASAILHFCSRIASLERRDRDRDREKCLLVSDATKFVAGLRC